MYVYIYIYIYIYIFAKCVLVVIENVDRSYGWICTSIHLYRGADKSLARPGRKQATATNLLPFANHSKTIQKVVRPTRSPRQQ